jgi:polynucleotide 5'-kinase involved in rRNA processing
VIDLPRSPAARQRDTAARQAHRARQFASYFAAARPVAVDWRRLAVFPAPRFRVHQLAALEDVNGFSLGLGVIQESDFRARQVTLYTPLEDLAGVDALRLGDLMLDLQSFRDQRLV